MSQHVHAPAHGVPEHDGYVDVTYHPRRMTVEQLEVAALLAPLGVGPGRYSPAQWDVINDLIEWRRALLPAIPEPRISPEPAGAAGTPGDGYRAAS